MIFMKKKRYIFIKTSPDINERYIPPATPVRYKINEATKMIQTVRKM